MDTATLRTFVVAAQCENFRLTARRRFISQATVTQQIQRLEAELGASLFDRRGRSIRLSSAGRRFQPHAERILQEAAAAISALADAGAETQPLAIAASPHIARTLLPQALRRLRQQLPTLEWSLSVVPSEEVTRHVAEGLSQVGFTRQLPGRSGLSVDRVAVDPHALIVPYDGRDLEHPLPPAEGAIEDGPLFTCDPQATRVAIDGCLRALGLRPRHAIHVGQVDVARALLLAGFGASFLPRSAVLGDLRTGRLLALDLPGATLPEDVVYAVTGAQPPRSAATLVAACRVLGTPDPI